MLLLTISNAVTTLNWVSKFNQSPIHLCRPIESVVDYKSAWTSGRSLLVPWVSKGSTKNMQKKQFLNCRAYTYSAIVCIAPNYTAGTVCFLHTNTYGNSAKTIMIALVDCHIEWIVNNYTSPPKTLCLSS